MIHFQFPTAEQCLIHWDELIKFLQPAIDESNGELTERDVMEKLVEGSIILAAVYDDQTLIAVVVYEMIHFDSGKKVINIQLAGGERLDEWFRQAVDIANYIALERDADDIYVIGRPGWQRKLKQLGFEVVHTVLHKEVK